jgi:hypothetical protein
LSAIDLAKNIIDSFTNIENELQATDKAIRMCDTELCDIMHEIELTKFNACEGYYLTKEIQRIRKLRREWKDYEEQLDILKRFLGNHKNARNELRNLIKVIEEKKEHQIHRMYTPRVRNDLKVVNVNRELQVVK